MMSLIVVKALKYQGFEKKQRNLWSRTKSFEEARMFSIDRETYRCRWIAITNSKIIL
jgi:hypothetical protein